GQVGNSDAIGGLTNEGLDLDDDGVIDNALENVTFNSTVRVNGDLIIRASGIVTFQSTVNILGGGNLIIEGASQVIFMQGVSLAGGGNMFIEGDEINFAPGTIVSGSGVLTLRP